MAYGEVCSFSVCRSTIIAGRCPTCQLPLCGPHLNTTTKHYAHKRPRYVKEEQHMPEPRIKATVKEVVGLPREVTVACTLCSSTDAWVYRGLATLDIEYEGETRFICDTCIEKIKRA